MSAADIVSLVLCVFTMGGLAITCLIDPAGLVDKKYGKRSDSK